MKYSYHLFIILITHLLISVQCQGGGGGGGGVGGGGSFAIGSHKKCKNCCEPNLPISSMTGLIWGK